jgi:hypothetical protein
MSARAIAATSASSAIVAIVEGPAGPVNAPYFRRIYH